MYQINPLPRKLAVKNLRELAAAWEAEEGARVEYPHNWLRQRRLSGRSYQEWYNALTGRDPFSQNWGNDGLWVELCGLSAGEMALFWYFLAEALNSGEIE